GRRRRTSRHPRRTHGSPERACGGGRPPAGAGRRGVEWAWARGDRGQTGPPSAELGRSRRAVGTEGCPRTRPPNVARAVSGSGGRRRERRHAVGTRVHSGYVERTVTSLLARTDGTYGEGPQNAPLDPRTAPRVRASLFGCGPTEVGPAATG